MKKLSLLCLSLLSITTFAASENVLTQEHMVQSFTNVINEMADITQSLSVVANPDGTIDNQLFQKIRTKSTACREHLKDLEKFCDAPGFDNQLQNLIYAWKELKIDNSTFDRFQSKKNISQNRVVASVIGGILFRVWMHLIENGPYKSKLDTTYAIPLLETGVMACVCTGIYSFGKSVYTDNQMISLKEKRTFEWLFYYDITNILEQLINAALPKEVKKYNELQNQLHAE